MLLRTHAESRIKIIYRQKVGSTRGSLEWVIYYSNLYILLPRFPLYSSHFRVSHLCYFGSGNLSLNISSPRFLPSLSLSYSLQHLSASVWHLFFYASSSHFRRIHPFSVDPKFLSFFPLTLRTFLRGLYIEKWVMMRPSELLTDFKILQIFHFSMLPSNCTWIKIMTLLSVLTSL
jgi:hypothetical protein